MNEPTIKEALDASANAIKSGDLKTGKAGLKWVLEREPDNVLAWLWMSRCTESAEEKLECFNRVLEIDPSNRHALEGVQRHGGGDKIQESPTSHPTSSAAPSAQASAKQHENVETKGKPNRRRWLMIIGGGLFLMCMCSFVVVALAPDSDEATEVANVSGDSQAEQPPADSATAEPTDAPPPTNVPVPTSTPRPSATPEPTQSLEPSAALENEIRERLRAGNREGIPRLHEVAFDYLAEPGVIFVKFAINDNFTEAMILGGAELDHVDMLQAITESGIDYSKIRIIGTFALVDIYGNVSEDPVTRMIYERATVEAINWDNFLFENIYGVADDAWTHPTFTD